ncbi:MAG: DUF1153 domain-containing protein [Pseudomonadota bacterium]
MNKIVSLDTRRDIARHEELRRRLPAPDTRRWVASRKAAVVAAVDAGAISRQEAMARYRLSDEELDSWCESLSQHGVPALFATRVQVYRNPKNE